MEDGGRRREDVKLADDKLVRGLVLHDHGQLTPYSARIEGTPISTLWQD
jgi:hypothetical protein